MKRVPLFKATVAPVPRWYTKDRESGTWGLQPAVVLPARKYWRSVVNACSRATSAAVFVGRGREVHAPPPRERAKRVPADRGSTDGTDGARHRSLWRRAGYHPDSSDRISERRAQSRPMR